MKKFFAILITAAVLLSLAACGKQTPAPTAAATTPAAQTPTTSVETPTEPAEPVDPLWDENMPKKLLRTQVTSLPVGNNDMTYEERRQLCLDFMDLQVTAQWKSNMNFEFQMTNYNKGNLKYITTDEIYGGIFYHSKGFSNPYRWLEYYDETTGIMDMETAIAENGGIGEGAATTDEEYNSNNELTYQKFRSLMTLGNQCSSTTCWSWGRVINSVAFGDTCDLNVSNGYIPVGCFDYSYEYEGKTYKATDIRQFGVKDETNPIGYDTDDVIADWNKANGENAMFECYAQLKPGDCLVNKGHALMVVQVNPYVSRDGTVDYSVSTVMVKEQVEAWSHKGQINGISFKQQGRDAYGYTFEKLLEESYIPFTFAELLDPNNEQDKKHLDYYHSYKDQLPGVKTLYNTFDFTDETNSDAVEKAVTYCTYEGDSISYEDFTAMVVGSNYAISDMFVTVTDSTGAELMRNVWRADFSNYREVPMSDHKGSWAIYADGSLIPMYDGISDFAGGENTVMVTMQLSTGELLTAYTGTLK